MVVSAALDVFNQYMETVLRLYKQIHLKSAAIWSLKQGPIQTRANSDTLGDDYQLRERARILARIAQ